jgi:predicted alpha/beta hydrolase
MVKILFPAADGYELKGLWMQPVAEHKGTVLLNSATGVRKEYYLNLAQYLVQQGYRVMLYDYRGIGESAPASLKGFTAYMHEWATKDMNGALNFLIKEKKATDVIWIGHSVGAQLMGVLTGKQYIKKVIGVNTSTGYWAYFPFPYNLLTFFLWTIISPLPTRLLGYAPMNKFGWGEPLPKDVFFEWRNWCMQKNHFENFLQQHIGKKLFDDFTVPFTVIHTTDDYIANSKTVKKLLEFYPNSKHEVINLHPADYQLKAIGHTGIFRKKHMNTLWPLVIKAVEDDDE